MLSARQSFAPAGAAFRMIALIAPLMPRRVSPSGFVIRLDRWIAALRILNNSAAEAEEMWDEPSMGQRDGPPQQAGRHTDVDPTKVQFLHTVLTFLAQSRTRSGLMQQESSSVGFSHFMSSPLCPLCNSIVQMHRPPEMGMPLSGCRETERPANRSFLALAHVSPEDKCLQCPD